MVAVEFRKNCRKDLSVWFYTRSVLNSRERNGRRVLMDSEVIVWRAAVKEGQGSKGVIRRLIELTNIYFIGLINILFYLY